jgi:hypothetical protein
MEERRLQEGVAEPSHRVCRLADAAVTKQSKNKLWKNYKKEIRA